MTQFVRYSLAFTALIAACWAQGSLSLAAPVHGVPPKGAVAASQPKSTYNGIDYHGCPVMNDPPGVNVYLFHLVWELEQRHHARDTDRLQQAPWRHCLFQHQLQLLRLQRWRRERPDRQPCQLRRQHHGQLLAGTHLSDNDAMAGPAVIPAVHEMTTREKGKWGS